MLGIKKKLYSESLINANTKIKGNIVSEGEILIDGELEGDIECKNLILGINGLITGKINVEKANINGVVNGDIHASSVYLASTARIKGNIYHKNISIQTGAFIDGDLKRTQ